MMHSASLLENTGMSLSLMNWKTTLKCNKVVRETISLFQKTNVYFEGQIKF